MRSRRLIMSHRSLNDLLGIHNYIADSNPVAALQLLNDINRQLKWMAQTGVTGVPRPFIPALRAFPYRERCIYFFVSENAMTVMRILHGRQNTSAEDFTESAA